MTSRARSSLSSVFVLGSTSLIFRNAFCRLWRRLLDVPARGFPAGARKDSFDGQYGTDTGGVVWLTNLRSRNFTSGIRYEPCPPKRCRLAIEQADIDPEEFCFVDVGCGKGRPLIIASQYGFRRLIGVEYSASLCRTAERNLALCGAQNAEIAAADAAEFDYPRANTFAFFFHPFQADVLDAVLERLRAATSGHQLVIAYVGSGGSSVSRAWLESLCETPSLRLFRKTTQTLT
jgi:SAM-dependent methyltransferase